MHEHKECKTCKGHGLWATGKPLPMGPIDAGDGMPTIPCPECGANANPRKKGLEFECDCDKPHEGMPGTRPECCELRVKRKK